MAELALLTGDYGMSTISVEGYTAKEGEDMNPHYNGVGPGYFATLGIPLVLGREFTAHDGPKATKVGVVNETLARYFFGNESPIGKHFGFGRGTPMDVEIVAVVKDGKAQSLRQEIPRFVYIPYMQEESLAVISFYVRTGEEPAAAVNALRRLVQNLDPALPVFAVKAMEAQVDESLFIERMVAILSACFGFLATLLAAIGLYGVMSYTVARRTREIGIRMALGAERRSVLWLVLKEVGVMAAVGMAIGIPAAKGMSRLVQSQLFGFSGADPLTLALAAASLATVALLAGYVPAERASRIDPMVALRYE